MTFSFKIYFLIDEDPARDIPRMFPTPEAAQAAREKDMEEFWADYEEHYVCPFINWSAIEDPRNPPAEVINLLNEWEKELKQKYGDPLPDCPPYPGFEKAHELYPDYVAIIEVDFCPAPSPTPVTPLRAVD